MPDKVTIVPANEASWADLRAIFGRADYPARCLCQRLKVKVWCPACKGGFAVWRYSNELQAFRENDSLSVFHVVRAHLLRRLGRTGEAVHEYNAAIAYTENFGERAFLERQRDADLSF